MTELGFSNAIPLLIQSIIYKQKYTIILRHLENNFELITIVHYVIKKQKLHIMRQNFMSVV